MNNSQSTPDEIKLSHMHLLNPEAIGVYKTNVTDQTKAEMIVSAIHPLFPNCRASFDLENCDCVLRLENRTSGINERKIRSILQHHGHKMESLL